MSDKPQSLREAVREIRPTIMMGSEEFISKAAVLALLASVHEPRCSVCGGTGKSPAGPAPCI